MQLKTRMIFIPFPQLLSARLASWSGWLCGDSRANTSGEKVVRVKASTITLLLFLWQWRLTWFQTDCEAVPSAKACPHAEIQWNFCSKIYQDIILLLGSKIAVSHWDSNSGSRKDPRAHWWQNYLMRVLSLSLCASLSTVLKNSYDIPLVSLGLLVDSAENQYLYSLFCVPKGGAL